MTRRMDAVPGNLLLLALLTCLLGGCGTVSPGAGPGGDDRSAPPPVTISFGDESEGLDPWTFCYDGLCADGFPPQHPVDVGSPEQVAVDFPLDGWKFQATFSPAGERCGREQIVQLGETGDGSLVLRPAGYAGSYDVTLFGRGDGDLVVTFRWTTPHDGPLPDPKARLAVLADHDGEVDSYGVEMSLSNLAETPDRVDAEVTVTSPTEETVTFEPRRRRGCLGEGTVAWNGPRRVGKQAARMGGESFRYHVEVTLDGTRHVADARWPQDVIKGNEPSVRLHFDPPLPALEPR